MNPEHPSPSSPTTNLVCPIVGLELHDLGDGHCEGSLLAPCLLASLVLVMEQSLDVWVGGM